MAGVARPSNREQAWNSIAYAVARCLSSGSSASLENDFELSPEIARLLEITTLNPHDVGPGAELEVELADGSRRQVTVVVPSGHAEHPADDEQLIAKWDRMLGSGGSETLHALKEELPTRNWHETVRLVLKDRTELAGMPLHAVGKDPSPDNSGGDPQPSIVDP